MSSPRRRLPVLALAFLVAGACEAVPAPSATPPPSPGRTAAPMPSAAAERPFSEAAWPAEGSWCDVPEAVASGVRIGRIEAPDARTVRFRLCAPDAAFAARLADPVAGVVDAAEVDAISADPSRGRFAAGGGRYRVDAWHPGDNVRLARVADKPGGKGDDITPTVILRWSADPSERVAALGEGSVDAIDGIGGPELETVATMPELVTLDRDGLATAYLGFGSDPDFASVAVRKAFGQGLDRDALTSAAFPAGSVVASHLSPCIVPLGCSGPDWYESNAPAAAADLKAAKFDRTRPYPLYIPSEPVPGLPDPAALGEAVRAQAEELLGVTLEVTPTAPAELDGLLASRRLRGLYLAGVSSRLADASGFLDPLFGAHARGVAVDRAGETGAALASAAATTDVDARADAFREANGEIRSKVPVVPIAHPGDLLALRDDVRGAEASPLAQDPLGRWVPGDRPQLVMMQASEPDTAWCAVASRADDRRLCGLVTPGLLVFRPGTLLTAPGLANRCTPDARAVTWTCRLRADARFSSGARIDAGDVIASFAAQGDPASRLRAVLPADSFAAWDALFGAPAGSVPAPVPTGTPATPEEVASGSPTASP